MNRLSFSVNKAGFNYSLQTIYLMNLSIFFFCFSVVCEENLIFINLFICSFLGYLTSFWKQWVTAEHFIVIAFLHKRFLKYIAYLSNQVHL